LYILDLYYQKGKIMSQTHTLESRFTQEEQSLLTNTPFAIGSTMVFAGGSGLGTVKEMFANTSTYLKGIKEYPNNEIIVAILPNIDNFSNMQKDSKALQDNYKNWIAENNIDSYESMKSKVLEDSGKVSLLLDEKATSKEASEYKDWAMSIARNVAQAAKEGGFLGIGGERVSQNEKDFFNQVAQALGSTSTLE